MHVSTTTETTTTTTTTTTTNGTDDAVFSIDVGSDGQQHKNDILGLSRTASSEGFV